MNAPALRIYPTGEDMRRSVFGPTEAEVRAAWAHLSTAELRRLMDKARDEGEIHTAAILAEEVCRRAFGEPLTECLSDPLKHIEPRRNAA